MKRMTLFLSKIHKKTTINRLITAIVSGFVLLLSNSSCSDDLETPAGIAAEGEPALISLKVELNEMKALSRADMDKELENKINSLWVGVYDFETKNLVTQKTFTSGDFTIGQSDVDFKKIELTTTSGNRMILAVANPIGNSGIDVTGINQSTDLITLLEDADTYDKFRSIAVSQNFGNTAQIQVPVNSVQTGLVMSGAYFLQHNDSGELNTIENVTIAPGTTVLPGAIHLKRLWTQNIFRIEPSDNVIDLEVLSIQVYNVPKYSWLSGRRQQADSSTDNILGYSNAGDAVNPSGSPVNNTNYPHSLLYTPTDMTIEQFTDGNNNRRNRYIFDYWQFENKRTGIIEGNDYQKRELEYNTGGAEDTGPGSAPNSGIFSSLSPEGGDLNNLATYVRIRANITYRNPGNLENPTSPVIPDLPNTVNSRTAVCTYTVHLGYVNPSPQANDFNCNRNSKYTYNIKIRSVNDIIVEAFREGEKQPGAEGMVTDVTNRLEQLDAHSGAFNIYLSDEELKNFTFSMTTFYDFQPKSISIDEDGKWTRPEGTDSEPKAGEEDFKFYNWIEFVPNGFQEGATDNGGEIPTAIAPYPNLTTGTGTISERRKGKVYYCGELRKAALAGDLAGQWFTVYVNEYTYEKRYGEDGWGNEEGDTKKGYEWKNYVNQPDRHAWFNVSQSTSGDGKSAYFKSKYAVAQKSIQTYYNYDSEETTNAIGVEHTNESFGMNLRWTVTSNESELDPNNGRYNVWKIAGETSSTRSWNSFLSLNKLQHVNAITNTKQTAPANIPTAARNYPVPSLNTIPTSSLTGSNNGNEGVLSLDPQNSNINQNQYIQTIYACMNRNRDENGNGAIDQAELKWYVPTSGKMLRVIIGRNVLVNPIMDYTQSYLPYTASGGENTLFHFGTSDNKIVWTEEGMSSNYFAYGSAISPYRSAPWQVRCIRNLGTNLTIVKDGERIEPAYREELSSTGTYGGVVKVLHYYGSALRTNQVDPLPMHKSNDDYNKLGQYGFEIAPRGNNFNAHINVSTNEARVPKLNPTYTEYNSYIDNATPCNTLNNGTGGANGKRKGWRVPNQKEIVIMLRLKIFGNANNKSGNRYWYGMSCTQEYYSQTATSGKYEGSETTGANYRQLTVELEKLVNNIGVGIATAHAYNDLQFVRCVRDLTAAEAHMKYDEILNYTTP